MRPFLGRSAGWLADKTLLKLMKSSGRYPGDEDYSRVQGEVRATHALYRGNGMVNQPLGFHTDPPPLIDPEVTSGWYPGLRYEILRFQSGYRPPPTDAVGARWSAYEPNRSAYAWTLRHPEPDRPWLVCLHGIGTGNAWVDFMGFRARHLHHHLGMNLIFPVLPLHGPRRDERKVRGALLSYDLVDTIHGMAQAVWDTRRLIGWARAQGATKIGLFGLSLGAYAASLTAAFEEVDLAMAGIPLCDVPDLFAGHSGKRHKRRAYKHGVLGDKVKELYRLVSPLNLPPKVPHHRRFIFAGRTDRVTGPAQAKRLWDAWDRPQIHWYHGGHVSFFWNREVARFVDRALVDSDFASPGRR